MWGFHIAEYLLVYLSHVRSLIVLHITVWILLEHLLNWFFSFLTLVLMLLFILTHVNHIIDVFIYRLSDKTFQILIFTQKLSSLIGCIKWCLAFEEYSGSGCRLSQPKIVYPYIWDSLEEQRGRGGWLNLPHFPANWTLLWAKFNYLMQSCYRFILDHGAT